MNLIYLKKFNNYYNRRVKYYEDVLDYLNVSEDYFINDSVDFNPNDYVSTTKIANLDSLNFSPDYLLVLDEGTNNISSRWFVLEMKRLRNGQYNITLRRDVIADYYNQLYEAPIFVQKGNLQPSNPLIFNNEGMRFNQIKTSETVLKDETGTAWIVGYLANNAFDDGEKTITMATDESSYTNISSLPIRLDNPLDLSEGGTLTRFSRCSIQSRYKGPLDADLTHTLSAEYDPDFGFTNFSNTQGGKNFDYAFKFKRIDFPQIPSDDEILRDYREQVLINEESMDIAIDSYFRGIDKEVVGYFEAAEIKEMNGQIVYSSAQDKYFRMQITTNEREGLSMIDLSDENPKPYEAQLVGILNLINNEIVEKYPQYLERVDKIHPYRITYKLIETKIEFFEVLTGTEMTTTLTPSHNKLNDAPYSLFALPFNERNFKLANRISVDLSNFVYDIQILPYCPVLNKINGQMIVDVDYNSIYIGENEIDKIYWATTSSGTFNIPVSIKYDFLDPIEMKVANECDMYRLVSPNYNGAFEFSPIKNNGVEFFEVSYTYKPYVPYIQVNPAFNGLYGKDFNDARGLICNGDFSIATITDQWKNYQINNKNYENIFNAQIKTMDKNNQLSLVSQGVSSSLNAISTGISVGMMGGGPIGGIAAGAASALAGAADMAIGQSIYQNNRQLQKDLFNFNLQTVAARPDTLNKISSYNINNKYFPFIEYYTCTDEEKIALRNKLKYEGMTVGVIGKISDFINTSNSYNYFKGQLIINDEIADDYHVLDAIGVELEKGVYL